MYYVAKGFQAAGLGVMAMGFGQVFPRLMSPKIFLLAIALFGCGWLIQRFTLK